MPGLHLFMARSSARARRALLALRHLLSLLAGVCLELGDQAAYQRHLRWHGRTASPEEWRRFSEARFRAKFERPKCC